MTAKQVGPLMGIVFVICIVAALLVGGMTPSVNDSTQKIVSYYTDNDTEQFIAMALLWLSAIAFVCFVASLRQRLRAIAGDDGGLSTVMTMGAVIFAVGGTIFSGLTLTLADGADDMPATATVALNALNSDMIVTVSVGIALFSLGLGLAVLRHGGLPRALGWLALVIGVVAVIPAPTAFFAFLVSLIVVIWASVVMLRDVGTNAPSTAPTPTVP